MPVPKRKTSKSRRDMRQSCKFIRVKQFAQCQPCADRAEPIVSFLGAHQACQKCGFYKGRQVVKNKLDRAETRQLVRDAQAAKEAAAAEAQPGEVQ
jgi:large subunit ribosomal protein L32